MPKKTETIPGEIESASVSVHVTDAPPADAPKPPENPGDKPPEAAAVPDLLTPTEWAQRKGLLVDNGREPPFATGFHAEAEQLHGWAWHAHNYQLPEQAFRLSEADYDAALVAASMFPAKPAHAAAIATHYPAPVVPEHIAKACAAAEAKAAEAEAAAAKKAES